MNAAQGSAGEQNARISGTVPWCSGLAYVPVKDEIAGSNPVGTASVDSRREERRQFWLGSDSDRRPTPDPRRVEHEPERVLPSLRW